MTTGSTISGLRFDAAGFLVGARKLAQDVQQIETNTDKIIEILDRQEKELREGLAPFRPTALQKILMEANKPVIDAIQEREQEQARQRQRNPNTGDPHPHQVRIPRPSEIEDHEQRVRTPVVNGQSDEQSAGNGRERTRDSRGRFSSGENSDPGLKRVEQLYAKLASLHMGADVSRVDPTVDAMRELGSMLSPVRKVAAFALKPLSGVFKMRKRKEPLPDEQSRHNREEISVLKKILKALGLQRSGSGAGAGGLLGGLGGLADNVPLGGGRGLLKKAGKLLRRVRGVPIIGALAAGLSLYDWNEQSTEEKGGTVGSIAGGVAGGALGSILGPLGTVAGGAAGAWIGEKIGEAVAPKVEKWTSSLIAADLPGRMSAAWDTLVDGLNTWFKQKIEGISQFAEEAATTAKDAAVNAGVALAYNSDKVIARLGNEAAKKRVATYEANQNKTSEPVQPVTKPKGKEITLGQVFKDTKDAAMKQPEKKRKDLKLDLNNPRLKDQTASGKFAPLLDQIAEGEAKGGAFGTFGYDAIYAGAKVRPPKPISQMSIAEVKAYQQQLVENGAESTASGRYQFIRNKGMFAKMVEEAGLKDSDIFDNVTQDKLALHYAGGEQQIDKWIKEGNYRAITNKVAQQWASQKNTKGVGVHDGDGLNTARHGGLDTIKEISKQIQKNEGQVIPPKALVVNAQIPTIRPSVVASPLAMPQVRFIGSTGYVPPKIPTQLEATILKKISGTEVTRVQVMNSNDNISQNISNRQLAHAVTGGLGMSRDYD